MSAVTSFEFVVLRPFGFKDLRDLFASTFKPNLILVNLSISALLAGLVYFAEQFIGLSPAMLWGFVLLNIIEFWTGVRASLHEGKRFSSQIAGRFLFKVVIYLGMLHVATIFASDGAARYPTVGPIYEFVKYLLFNGVSIILFRSVFENLHRLQVKEAHTLYIMFDTKYTKFIAAILAPPDDEKKNRV